MRTLTLLIAGLLLSTPLVAQVITGDIRGVVMDQSGAALTGAKVQIFNTGQELLVRERGTIGVRQIVEVVVRVQLVIAEELVDRTVERVRAATSDNAYFA